MPLRFVALFAATTALVLGCALPASAGELQQADRTLLARLKQHTLWAIPAGRLAAHPATNQPAPAAPPPPAPPPRAGGRPPPASPTPRPASTSPCARSPTGSPSRSPPAPP